MSIDPKFVELTADVLKIFFNKIDTHGKEEEAEAEIL